MQGTDLVIKRSADGGSTWSTLALFYSNSTADEVNVVGNAAPVQDRRTGRIFVPFCRNNEQIFMSYSDDEGLTWSTPQNQPQLVGNDWKWVGVGPPGSLQLSSGRLLVPGYHTDKVKGDGCASHGHTIYSDDGGLNWQLGNVDFGRPFLANECQAVELTNGSVLINARTLTNHRIQLLSNDGGITFTDPSVVDTLIQPLEGCEGSIVRDALTSYLYFSDPYTRTLTRLNMTIFISKDEGSTWEFFRSVDTGSVAYSSMQSFINEQGQSALEILYERSDNATVVFEPQEIVYWRVF